MEVWDIRTVCSKFRRPDKSSFSYDISYREVGVWRGYAEGVIRTSQISNIEAKRIYMTRSITLTSLIIDFENI